MFIGFQPEAMGLKPVLRYSLCQNIDKVMITWVSLFYNLYLANLTRVLYKKAEIVNEPQLQVLYYEKHEPLPEELELRAEPLSLIFEDGDVQYFRLGERRKLRWVDVAIRNYNKLSNESWRRFVSDYIWCAK